MARWQQALATGLDVRPGEGESLALLFLQSFLAGLCFVYFETAASALFLSVFEVEMLPWAYVASAGLATGLGVLHARGERRLPPVRLLQVALALAVASVLGFAAAYPLAPPRWLAAALMAWKEVLWMLFTLVFWGLAGCVFNVRQGKRLFPIAASGALLSGLLGGLTVAAVVQLGGMGGLAAAAALAALLTLATGLWLTRRFADRLELAAGEDESGEAEPLMAMLRRPYLRLFFAIGAVSVIAFYVLDYAFYATVDAARPDGTQLATFFGSFYALVNLTNLLVSGLLAGRLISRFGVGLLLCAVPLVIAAGAAAASASVLVAGPALLAFWLVVATKLADEVLREAFDEPVSRVLYQPLPGRLRLSVQAKRESLLEPCVGGLCALVLLAASALTELAPLALLVATLVACLLWLALAERMRGAYAAALESAVGRRRLQREETLPADAGTLAVLVRCTASPEPEEALYALHWLEQVGAPGLDECLLSALAHPADAVRLFAAERIEASVAPGAEAALRARLPLESDPRVRGRLLRSLAVLAESELPGEVVAGLDDPHPAVRRGATVGLLRSGRIDGVLRAGERLHRDLAAVDPAERALAAEALGEVGVPGLHPTLRPLLHDPSPDVRRAALRAAGRLAHARLVRPMLAALADPEVREASSAALLAIGEAALPPMAEALRDPATDPGQARRLVRIAGRIGGAGATQLLLAALEHPSRSLHSAACEALARCGHRVRADEAPRFERALRAAVARAAWCWAGVGDLGDTPGCELVTGALARDIRASEDDFLDLLSCVYPTGSVVAARRALRSDSPDTRARALEILESRAGGAHRTLVLALLDEVDPERRSARLARVAPQPRLPAEERLARILDSGSPAGLWTLLCSLHLVGRERLVGLRRAIDPHRSHPLAAVRETASWSWAQCG